MTAATTTTTTTAIPTPRTNVKVVFGTMTFGRAGVEQSRVHSLEDCQAILDVVKSHGHRELDSARMYGCGSSEEYLNALQVEKQGFKVATKVFPSARMPSIPDGWTPYDHTKEGIKRCLDDSLKALGTQKVDLYYLHAPDREVPLEETLEAINAAYEAGHFTRFGISNYTASEVEAIVSICSSRGFVKPSVYQGLYNSVARAAEAALLPVLRAHAISYYCYNPLGGGFFTGRISAPTDEVQKGSRFDPDKWQGISYRKRYYREEYFRALSLLKTVCEKEGDLSMAEVALRWLQHHSLLDSQKFGDAIIIGASSLHHIRQNLLDLEKGPLPDHVLRAVEEAWKIVEPNAPPYHF